MLRLIKIIAKIIMFSSQFANTSRSRQIKAIRRNSSEISLEGDQFSTPWVKSSVSLTSTVDSPIISSKKCPSELHDAESDESCYQF